METESATTKNPFFGHSPFVAYNAAVTAATLCFVIFNFIRVVIDGQFESATGNSYSTRLMHLSLMMLLFFVVGWIFAFLTAFVPFFLGWFAAVKLKISHWSFFVIGAALTAILITPIAASIPNLGINVGPDEPSLLEKCLKMAPMFAGCGVVAGFFCWRVLRRR